MHPRRPRRFGTLFDRAMVLIGGIGVMAVVLLAFWFFYVLEQRRIENSLPLENTTWAAYQLVFEYHRFFETAQQAQLGSPDVSRDDLMFRLDILYSRVLVVQSGVVGEILLSDAELAEAFGRFRDGLAVLDDLAARSGDLGAPALGAEMAGILVGLDAAIRTIGLRAHHLGSELQAEGRYNLESGLAWLGVLMTLSLLLLSAFAGISLYQTARLRRAYRDKEAASVMAVRAREQAERASQAKSRLLANTSHELRTPLNAILGFSDIIRTESFGPVGVAKYKAYADDINTSAQLLLDLINDLLDLSRIEAGKAELDEEMVDPVALCEQSIHLVREIAERRSIDLALHCDGPAVELRADPRLVKQMLQNLLSNAVKFNRPNGRVDIHIAGSPSGDLTIAVADTGVGIPAAELFSLVEPFQQASTTRDNPERGTGLGLSIVRRLIELHDGRLTLTSGVDQGTTATLSFPKSRLAVQGDGGADRHSPSDPRRSGSRLLAAQ